jgi:hypothetical protein
VLNLRLSRPERLQLFLRVGYRFGEQLLLLRDEFRVARIEFEEGIHLFQFALKTARFFVDVLERLAESRRVRADFYGYALDACRQMNPSSLYGQSVNIQLCRVFGRAFGFRQKTHIRKQVGEGHLVQFMERKPRRLTKVQRVAPVYVF